MSLITVDSPPKAATLIESMRDIGYSLETALADIIDNSITAGATKIGIHVETSGSAPVIGIVDNGCGMTRDELITAMRVGSRNPLDARRKLDLGRFGLGLKTASFSQCRRLTVVAQKAGERWAATWDLDFVAAQDMWALQVGHPDEQLPFLDQLQSDGVLVLWQKLDRAVEQQGTEAGRRHFVARVSDARNHLELVFHRFLSGEPGLRKTEIRLNNLTLVPFDPFHASHMATIQGRTEIVRIKGHDISIKAFTLPHHRNVSAAEWEQFAGASGYVKNQGFYLYRERRLIIHGTWFGLARQGELTKLCRVRIDTPNSLDSEWTVDVKKAWARPPLQLRTRLAGLIRTLGEPSQRVYKSRGAKLYSVTDHVWKRVQENNSITYQVNERSPILRGFSEGLPDELKSKFANLLEVMSAAIPLDAIFADMASSPETMRTSKLAKGLLVEALGETVAHLAQLGLDGGGIRDALRVMEPFRSSWATVESILDELTDE